MHQKIDGIWVCTRCLKSKVEKRVDYHYDEDRKDKVSFVCCKKELILVTHDDFLTVEYLIKGLKK